ncbi:MAG TPA: MliC family protein [Casimicrobiaceae bacterium]|nr:MliC family protein [Casimicrobiaceae bacterium]
MIFARIAFLVVGGYALSLWQPSLASAAAPAAGSVDCASPVGSVDPVVCGDSGLVALDGKLVDVYAAAAKSAAPEQRNRLFAEQQSWLTDRARCSGAQDKVACMKNLYSLRIADLQATFKLVKSRGPFRFSCGKGPNDFMTAQYFETDPASARFFHDGRTVTAYIARSGSGARYENANVAYWEHQGEADVVWYGKKMTCNTKLGN